MTKLDIKTYASRALEGMQNYLDLSKASEGLEYILKDVLSYLQSNDEIVGCYYSSENERVVRFFISLNGLYIEQDRGFRFVSYQSIKNTILPIDKLNAFKYQIILEEGDIISIIVSGFRVDLMGRRLFDLYRLATFMLHVLNRNFNKKLE